MRLLLHLSGAHPSLPQAELEATLAATGYQWEPEAQHGRLQVGRVGRTREDAAPLQEALDRLALTHEASRFLFRAARTPEALMHAARAHPIGGDGEDTSFMVRAEYATPEADGHGPGAGRSQTERALGQGWSPPARVDLERPRRVLRAWIAADDVLVGARVWTNDRKGYRERAAKNRPYFSPVSGHPALMRAIVNLARVPPGGLLYDPLAGTGGILLEAGLAGLRVAGSDNDPAMVSGTRENLQRYTVSPHALFLCDVRESPERFLLATGQAHADAVVTDLPYGQSSSTGGADPGDVARWTLETAVKLLRPGGRLVIGTPQPGWLEPVASLGLAPEANFDVRVHKSLTRSYRVLQRAASA